MRRPRPPRTRRGRGEPKIKTLRRHASRRSLERVGVVLDPSTHKRIVLDIQEGRSTPIEKQSHRISVHQVELAGETVKVVYDRTRKVIVTVLPLDA
jgi:hypothetical protein